MMHSPLISVLIPMYNAGHGIRVTLESIATQTIDDYEVVIVNDGSTDDSVDIAFATHPGGRIISQKNSGIAKALNHGLEYCRGEFVARIDCYDICLPGRFYTQLAALQADPKIGAIGGHLLLYEADGSDLGICKFPTNSEDTLQELLHGNSAIPHTGAMIRRSYLKEVGGYDPFYNGREDFELWCRLSIVSSITNLDQVVVRSLSTTEGISYEGVFLYPLMELALLERMERITRGLHWKNDQLRTEYVKRIQSLRDSNQDQNGISKAKAIFHSKRGGFLLRSGNRSQARKEFLKVISYNKFNIKAYLGVISSCLLPNWVHLNLLRLMKNIKKRLRV